MNETTKTHDRSVGPDGAGGELCTRAGQPEGEWTDRDRGPAGLDCCQWHPTPRSHLDDTRQPPQRRPGGRLRRCAPRSQAEQRRAGRRSAAAAPHPHRQSDRHSVAERQRAAHEARSDPDAGIPGTGSAAQNRAWPLRPGSADPEHAALDRPSKDRGRRRP